jgi:hypothetical protein
MGPDEEPPGARYNPLPAVYREQEPDGVVPASFGRRKTRVERPAGGAGAVEEGGGAAASRQAARPPVERITGRRYPEEEAAQLAAYGDLGDTGPTGRERGPPWMRYTLAEDWQDPWWVSAARENLPAWSHLNQ